ncbi:MAG: hypothetical protein ACRD2O_18340, partial [Terriglobia bacterium]
MGRRHPGKGADSAHPKPGRSEGWARKFGAAAILASFLLSAQLLARPLSQQGNTEVKSPSAHNTASAPSGQEPAATAPSKIRIQSTIVNAPVTVMDASGNFVQNL